MITELYAIDRQLVDNLIENVVTIEIQSLSGKTWVFAVLPSENIVSESLEIRQSICDSEELQIGGCIPSQLTLDVMNTGDLSGKRIIVKIRTRYYSDVLFPSASLYPSTSLYPNAATQPEELSTDDYAVFAGVIFSCNRTGNRKIRRIVAFDRMYRADTIYCKNRIAKIVSQYQSRDLSFISLDQLLRGGHPSSGINISSWEDFINRGIDLGLSDILWDEVIDKKFTFLNFYKWMCELNGVYLIEDMPQNLTLSSATPRVIVPFKNMNTIYDIPSYVGSSLQYEEFITKAIHYAQFGYNDGRGIVRLKEPSTEGYSFYYSDNPLTNCNNGHNVGAIIDNLGSVNSPDHIDKITGSVYEYRPFKASVFNRWWVQVGDRVRLPVNDDNIPAVESIVLSKRIRGMYGMTVEIEAKGVKIMGKENDEE